MFRSQCPACGAPLNFQSAASTFAVCSYCSSTIVRKDEVLESLGKIAQLIDDASPVQLGAQGVYLTQAFQVIGRIQYRYDAGVWNEWHVMFASGRTAWLSELNGRSTMTFLQEGSQELPAYEQIKPGLQLTLQNQLYEVAYLAQARVVSGQGELPFAIGTGYEAPVVDLRGVGHPGFASLDYSDRAAPRLYLGLDVPFAQLKMSGLRQERLKELKADSIRALQCPNCGAAVQVNRADTRSITCAACHSTLGVEVEGIALLKKYEQAEFTEPPIPLGQAGVLEGATWTVVGFLQRYVEEEGTRYFWDEYLLLEESSGSYAWLTCDSEGWKFGKTLEAAPEVRGHTAVWNKEKYQLTEEGNAITDYVLGEFNWRVMQGARAHYRTYKRGNTVLSMEKTASEVSWSGLEEISSVTISKAFKIKLPDAVSTRFDATSSNRKNLVVNIFVVSFIVIFLIWFLSRNNCDPRIENCSSSSYTRGFSSGYSSGSGSHK